MRDTSLMVNQVLIERIQRRLAAMDLKPEAASKRAGRGRDYIRNIINGKSANPKTAEAASLARALRCRLEWLLFGEGPETDEYASLAPDETTLLTAWRAVPPEQRDSVAPFVFALLSQAAANARSESPERWPDAPPARPSRP